MLRILCCVALAAAAAAQGGDALGTASDRFSALYPSRAKTFAKASSDPDDFPSAQYQGNDDGFTGTNGCEAYRTIDQGTPLAVLAHAAGRPGVMNLFFRNFWSGFSGLPIQPNEDNTARIWLDGALAHDQPLSHYFRNQSDPLGQVPPFSGAFTASRAGGHVTHAQLRWNDEFRLGVLEDPTSNAARFHRVSFTLGTPENEVPLEDLARWETIAQARGTWPHAAVRVPQTASWTIAPGASAALPLTGPMTVLELTAQVGNHADWEHLWARFTFDKLPQPSVLVPLRLLGAMLAPPHRFPVQGLLFQNDGDRTLSSFYPMHFEDRATLQFENRGPAPIALNLTYATTTAPEPEPWGYFTVTWHSALTGTGETFFGPRLTNCRGLLRGLILEDRVDTTGRIPNMDLQHLEGDLCVRINGNRGSDHLFDASETSIGRWGWYLTRSDVPFVSDTSFNSSINLLQFPNGVYQARRITGSLYLFDPMHFVDGIQIALEHGVQNGSNAEYGLASFFYLQPGAARRQLFEIDIGSPASEAQHQVQFTEWSNYTRTGAFFRDQFFGTPAVTDTVRDIRTFLSFRVVRSGEFARGRPVGIGLRLDRLGGAGLTVCQADVFVDGQPAGLLHSFTHNPNFPWKEGNECEVELPRALTDGKAAFTVELRPRPGSDPLRVARVRVHEYVH